LANEFPEFTVEPGFDGMVLRLWWMNTFGSVYSVFIYLILHLRNDA
jgi:hypothetical protein